MSSTSLQSTYIRSRMLKNGSLVAKSGSNDAPCALGGGNSDLLAEAVGTNYFAESSVGEFILGNAAGLRTTEAEEK